MPKGRLRPDLSEAKTQPRRLTDDQTRANRKTRTRHKRKNKHNLFVFIEYLEINEEDM